MKSSIARVHVNGIEVGTLPADTYHQIVKTVRHTRRLYLAWALAAAGLVLRKVFQYIRAMPAALAGALFILLMVSPESFTQLLIDTRAAEPEEITQALRWVFHLIGVMAIIALPTMAIFAPRSWQIQNPFDSEISRQIRQLLEVPSEGDLMVEIIEQPGAE
ncbi:hypothetical protein U2H31_006377 [Pseudomonas aeruginosa]|nr:hypothetical protein [Pseudomonas aeruginosa]